MFVTYVRDKILEKNKNIWYLDANYTGYFRKQTEFEKGIPHSKFCQKLKNYEKIIIDTSKEYNNLKYFNYRENNYDDVFIINLEDCIKRSCQINNIAPSDIHYLTANVDDESEHITVHLLNSLLIWYKLVISKEALTTININQKKKHFCCLNLKLRSHRTLLINHLFDLDLLKYGYVSYDSTRKTEKYGTQNYFGIVDEVTASKFNKRKMVYLLDIQQTQNGFTNEYTCVPTNIFSDSYFSIVTETSYFKNRSRFITEKSYRPFDNFQFFISMSDVGTVDYLRKSGFDVFDDIVCHDYDNETNVKKRYYMVIDEIKKLCSMDLNDLHALYLKNQNRLLFNKTKLQKVLEEEEEKFNKFLSKL